MLLLALLVACGPSECDHADLEAKVEAQAKEIAQLDAKQDALGEAVEGLAALHPKEGPE